MKLFDKVKRFFGLKETDPADLFPLWFNEWDKQIGKVSDNDLSSQVDAYISWAYIAISLISETIGSQPLHLYRNIHKNGNITKEEITEHPILDLLKNVNPVMNQFDLKEMTSTFLELTGNCYWFLAKNRLNMPAEIWVLPSQDIKIVPSSTEFVAGYIYKPTWTTKEVFLEKEEVIHFKKPNPKDMYYGRSPLVAGAYAIDADLYIKKYQMALFKNNARPDGLLTSEDMLGENNVKRLRTMWDAQMKGIDNAGRVAILGKGLKWTQLSMPARDLAYIAGGKEKRDEILSLFKVPRSKLGLSEGINRANADANDYTFMKESIRPRLTRIQEKLNEQFTPLYGKDLFLEFDNPIPQDKIQRLKEIEVHTKTGYSNINEERAKDGLSPVKWGEVALLPMNLLPITSLSTGNGNHKQLTKGKYYSIQGKSRDMEKELFKVRLTSQENLMKKSMQRLFNKQHKEVQKRLNKLKSVKQESNDMIELVLFSQDEAIIEFNEVGGAHITEAYESGIRSAKRQVTVDIAFTIEDVVAQTFLQKRIPQFSFEVNDTTLKELRNTLAEGIKEGETIKQLSDRVNTTFNFAEKYRATRIARTETLINSNTGLMHTWKSAPEVVEGKEWLHGGGGLQPREDHIAIDGEKVGIDELFSNGLQYAGDPSAGAEDIINCTCTVLPIVKGA